MINTNNIKFNEEALRRLNSLIKGNEVKNASVTSRMPEQRMPVQQKIR